MKTDRETALLVLYEIECHGAYPNLALKKYLKHVNDTLDKAFITNLVYGVIKRKLTLDYVIEQFSNIKIKKLSDYIRQILRIGIYQILYMDKVPASAAVNESVKLAKRYGHGASAGYVNGVLRSVLREGVRWPESKMELLSVREAFPMWLCEKWVAAFGYEFTEQMMRAMNQDAALTLRANTLKTTAAALAGQLPEAKVHPLYAGALESGGFQIEASKAYREGLFIVQDVAAMMAGVALHPQEGERVIDLCAAPGGKTTHLAELMQNRGTVLAFDIFEHKIKLVQDNARRMGIEIIRTEVRDASVYDPALEGSADKILADVPCSGLGIIRRKPDIKWNKEEQSGIAAIQYRILENAGRYLKPGGALVYSTCTIDKTENERQIQRFLTEHPDFKPADFYALLPEPLRKASAREGHVTFYPNIDGVDGFFIAKLQKV